MGWVLLQENKFEIRSSKFETNSKSEIQNEEILTAKNTKNAKKYKAKSLS
jgi:hypothetical protein